jgi:unconventional prefoldin RPB5 interactor 1
MTDTVFERPFDSTAREDLEADLEMQSDMVCIAERYNYLRNRLINQSGGYTKRDSEKEIERIDEEGNTKKISRFKAARVSNFVPMN